MSTGYKRLTALVCLALVLAGVGMVYGEHQASGRQEARRTISVSEAHAKALAGEIVLVDIRTPDEWRETGVPASAHAITMNQDQQAFLRQIAAVMGGDRSRQLALICRTGNRSSTMQAALTKAGFVNVIDVAEGVAGSSYGKGWFKAGLPARPGSQAVAGPVLPARADAK